MREGFCFQIFLVQCTVSKLRQKYVKSCAVSSETDNLTFFLQFLQIYDNRKKMRKTLLLETFL